MKEIPLDGAWQGEGQSPEGETLRFDGRVPGCVHADLLRAGVLTDLFWRDNAENCQWIERWDWRYEKTFDAPSCEHAVLVFEGLDVYCEVFLNDRRIGEGDDMFVPHRFCVDEILRKGNNKLCVRFFSPTRQVAGLPEREGAFTTERLYTRREQCTYSWDWVNRFVTCGIWRGVRLVYPGEAEIDSVYIRTTAVDAFGAEVCADLAFSGGGEDLFVQMIVLDPTGTETVRKRRRLVEPFVRETFDFPHPLLWQPNGFGAAHRYTLIAEIIRNGETVSRRTERFGIRSLRVLQRIDPPGSEYDADCRALKTAPHLSGENAIWDRNETFSGFLLLVNGTPVFCKGANWVPSEPFPSEERDEKVRAILELARDAGLNMIRVWGGGIFESDFFYEECDRLGLLVTQDFLMACGDYPNEETWFRDALAREAEAAALRLRNHPCLAWWSGDNENAVAADDDMTHYPGRRTVRESIMPALRKFDPARICLPSSPYGGIPYGSPTCGTAHNTQFIGELFSYIRNSDLRDYRAYLDKYLARFVAEEPTMGAPMRASLLRFMTPEDVFGSDLTMWRYHTKNNPAEEFRTFELFDYLLAIAEKLFGRFLSGEDRLTKLQFVQYGWVRITMELFRRKKWFSSGILYWMLNDCWPSSGWSLIDYYALPKMAYYAVKRSSKAVICAISQEDGAVIVIVCNDSLHEVRGKGVLRLVDSNRTSVIAGFSYNVGANRSEEAYRIEDEALNAALDRGAAAVCDMEGDRCVFTRVPPAKMNLRKANVSVKRTDETHVVVKTDAFVYGVVLDGPFVFEDNGFALLAGESRTIRLKPAFEQENGVLSADWI